MPVGVLYPVNSIMRSQRPESDLVLRKNLFFRRIIIISGLLKSGFQCVILGLTVVKEVIHAT